MLGLLHLALALLSLDATPDTGGDNAAYLSLARALAQGRGYVELWDPAMRPHAQYPPVFPLLLAGALLLGVRVWVGLKVLLAFLSAAAVAISYLWLRRASSPRVALGVAALLALSPGVLAQSHWVLSDVPFWAFTALALWALAPLRAAAAGGSDAELSVARSCGAAIALVLAYFTRQAGLPLLLAACALFVMRRRFRDLVILTCVWIPLALLWWLRGARVGVATYTNVFWMVNPYAPRLGAIDAAAFFMRVVENAARYGSRHVGVLVFGEGAFAATGVLVVVLALVGWGMRVRRPGVEELWAPLYAGLLLAWPQTWSSERLLLPLLPLLLMYAGECLYALPLPTRARSVLPAAVLLGSLLLCFGPLTREIARRRSCMEAHRLGRNYACLAPPWRDLLAIGDSLRGRLPEGSVILSRKPTLMYVLSGYQGRIYPTSADPDSFFAAARAAGARWVVVDRVPDLAPVYLHPVLRARRDRFCVLPSPILPNASVARIDTTGSRRAAAVAPGTLRSCSL